MSAANTLLEELVLIADSSTKSSGSSAWQYILSFCNSIVNNLNVGPNSFRIAMIRYADSAQVLVSLGQCSSANCVTSAVSGIDYTGGDSNLAAALDLALSQVFSQARPAVPRVILFVTDYVPGSTSNGGLLQSMNNVQSSGVRMYGVGIQAKNSIDADTFYRLSFNNGQYSAIFVGDYNQLSNYVSQAVANIGAAAGGTTTSTSTTTATTIPTTTRPTSTLASAYLNP